MSEELEKFDAMSTESTSLLAPVEAEVVTISEQTATETILQVYDRCRFYGAEIKRIQKLCESAMIERIKASGPIEVRPGVRYVVTYPKTTKCVDVPAAVEAVLDAVQGDATRFCGALSSNALKHGACKKLLPPDRYAILFETTVKDKLEGGKPAENKLVRIDEAFL